MGIHRLLEVGQFGVGKRHGRDHTGVVHHYVEVAVRRDHRVDHGLDREGVGDVGGVGVDLAAPCAQAVDRARELIGVTRDEPHHRAA
jgi:hypothetical protein